eukprot:ANDGO_05425.mRNA.1 hypothetical protein
MRADQQGLFDARRIPKTSLGRLVSFRLGGVFQCILTILVVTVVLSSFDIGGIKWARIRAGSFSPWLVCTHGEWFRIFTSPVLHFSIRHAMESILSLMIHGIPVNLLIGNQRFVVLMTCCAIMCCIFCVVTTYVFTFWAKFDDAAGFSSVLYGICTFLCFVPFTFRSDEIVILSTRSTLWYKLHQRRRLLLLYFVVSMIFEALSSIPYSSSILSSAGHLGGCCGGLVFLFYFARQDRNRLFAVDALYDDTLDADAGEDLWHLLPPPARTKYQKALEWFWRERNDAGIREADVELQLTRSSVFRSWFATFLLFVVPVCWTLMSEKPWLFSKSYCERTLFDLQLSESSPINLPVPSYLLPYTQIVPLRRSAASWPINSVVSDVFQAGRIARDPYTVRSVVVSTPFLPNGAPCSSKYSDYKPFDRNGASLVIHPLETECLLHSDHVRTFFWPLALDGLLDQHTVEQSFARNSTAERVWDSSRVLPSGSKFLIQQVRVYVSWLSESKALWTVVEVNPLVGPEITNDIFALGDPSFGFSAPQSACYSARR